MGNHAIGVLSPCDLVNNFDAAKTLGVQPETLAQWRYLRKFTDRLPHYKVGRKVFYRRSDLIAFLNTCRVGGLQERAQ